MNFLVRPAAPADRTATARNDIQPPPTIQPLPMTRAASLSAAEVFATLATDENGLTRAEAERRARSLGPNAVRSHRARLVPVIARQLRSPLLLLLAVTATVSFFLGERSNAVVIGVIVAMSVGLGTWNEYRAEKAADALHERIRHRATAVREGRADDIDLAALVPGDIVELRPGELVPADLRLLTVNGLQCDESVLTGDSVPVLKSTDPLPADTPTAELSCCALMGTVVAGGRGRGVVTATGGSTQFGRIAAGLAKRQPETEFQIGLRKFSMLLVRVAAVLTIGIFAINLILHRPMLDALMFSLAIAVGISPQLLPASGLDQPRGRVETARTAKGDGQKAGLHRGSGRYRGPVHRQDRHPHRGPHRIHARGGRRRQCGRRDRRTGDGVHRRRDPGRSVLRRRRPGFGPVAVPVAPHADSVGYTRLGTVPFDHRRRMVSVLAETADGERLIITKGAPEAVLARCTAVPEPATRALDAEFAAGHRVVAVATRPAPGQSAIGVDDERDLRLHGFLVFLDPPKSSARQAISRLSELGVTVKIITGDHPTVAAQVCTQLGLPPGGALSGTDIDRLSDAELAEKLPATAVFARIDPEQKARIVRAQRSLGVDVAFLGDGVNDALALHAADVGISVDAATDVAKDAADVVLLEKDLAVLADGVTQGRRVFANTMKYVLMGTSSNFGNMFSAAGASAFLPFLPMFPSQILLNNLLYDTSQLAIPTDTVDEEQLARPARWDIHLIQRFMLVFGPISSVFDFATFAIMLWVFHAGETMFHTGWFVESLATQTLVLFVIRTRRTPSSAAIPVSPCSPRPWPPSRSAPCSRSLPWPEPSDSSLSQALSSWPCW